MAGVNVFAADDDALAQWHFTSVQQQFTNLFRGRPGRLQPPIDDMDSYWRPGEEARVAEMLTYSFVGGPETVRRGLEEFVDRTGVDEVIVATAMYDHAARLRSYELLAEVTKTSGSDKVA